MFTMTATKSSTCPVSGLTIEPGDTITRAGNKYTPWSLTKSEIDRKQRIATYTMPTKSAPEPSGICPLCLNDVYPGDKFCGECGHPLYGPPTEAMATSAKQERKERLDAYTIATDDEQPTVIAEVRHIEAPAPKALLGFSTPKRDVVIAEPTPEPIAPQKQPESRTDGKAVVLGETLAKAVKQITKPLAKAVPKKMRETCPGLAYVTVTLSPDGSTVATTIQTDADNPIEPIRFPLIGHIGLADHSIAVVLDYDNATILAGILDPKTDATITVENVLNQPIHGWHKNHAGTGLHLVINQTDKAGCRSRTRIKIADLAASTELQQAA